MGGGQISPIVYIEGRCDRCNDEIYSGLGAEFALMRNGDLVCKTCADLKPDEVLKNYIVEATVILEEETPEEEPEEIPDIETPEPEEIPEELDDAEVVAEEAEG